MNRTTALAALTLLAALTAPLASASPVTDAVHYAWDESRVTVVQAVHACDAAPAGEDTACARTAVEEADAFTTGLARHARGVTASV